MQEKSKIYNIHTKALTPPQTKTYRWQTPIFQTQEGSNQTTRFLNAKEHTPPKTKANQIKRQTQQKMPTPLEVESTRFHQLSLDTPQDKHKPLNNKANQSAYDLGTKATRARIIINDHKQNPLAIHNKKNVDHKGNSSQNRGRNQPTESDIYTSDEHNDGINMGCD
jgi:hypothetical protein